MHGANFYDYDKKLIDFSSNINVFNMNERLFSIIREDFDHVNVYPDIKAREAIDNVATYLACDASNIILGNGSIEIIDKAIHGASRVVIFDPSFYEYELRASVYKKELLRINYKDFKINFDELNILKKNDLLILTNPNNPNGRLLKKEELIKAQKICKEHGATLLLDEAFIEFTLHDYDSIKLFKDEDVIIVRAMTKTFALPGVRFGFAYVPKDFKDYYDELSLAWSTGFIQNEAAKLLANSEEYLSQTKKYYQEERNRLKNLYKDFENFEMIDSDANFYLIKLKKHNDEEMYKIMLEKGILIRKMQGYKNIGNNYIRLAIRTREENDYLIEKLREIEN